MAVENQCSLTGLFCMSIGLFCVCTGLFCVLTGLLCVCRQANVAGLDGLSNAEEFLDDFDDDLGTLVERAL